MEDYFDPETLDLLSDFWVQMACRICHVPWSLLDQRAEMSSLIFLLMSTDLLVMPSGLGVN